jgi:excinuclease ABC subunit A
MTPAALDSAAIVVRGARTHNLKNIDVTLPAGQLIVITGVSGSGKSSLAFDTIYAEGQRRYVESLSAYARQFLERMEKPDVDRIDGICPSIAIRQKNSVRNPRSTVGTVTEIHDYMRLLYARVGRTFCRQCGQPVIRETAEVVASQLLTLAEGTRLILGFDLPIVALSTEERPEGAADDGEGGGLFAEDADAADVAPISTESGENAVRGTLESLRRKGFGRVLIDGQAVAIEDIDVARLRNRGTLQVVVDRVKIEPDLRARLTDSIEIAYLEGGGAAWAVEIGGAAPVVHAFSERFECRRCHITYEDPQPRLFSFNNPFGACPTCHGFGNIIELDLELVVPDPSKSINQGAIEPWTKPHYRSHLAELKRTAKTRGIRLDAPWRDLSDADRKLIVEGDGGDYEGIRGFFAWLERKKYKVHVRVFLSRYRGYLTCPECEGTRLRREARDVRVGGSTIDRVSALTVRDSQRFFATLELTEKDAAIADKVLTEIQRRLGFLADVGLDYLTLDRLSATLSGGEAQRINLATSLGSALVGTLYVLDEPSIGLHTRDNQRLIEILRQLRDQGNTVLVVEHDADMITVADHVIDMGLGAGEHGGRVIFTGTLEALRAEPRSLTAKYLRGELGISVPATRRRGTPQRIKLFGAREHNLKGIDVQVLLNTLTVVTGVSGSGKSTLVHDVLYAALKRAKGDWDRKVGAHTRLDGHEFLSDVVLVDQAPIGRTPRSNPVTYLKAFDPIRELFATTKDAKSRGLTASHFSFNVPGGRCETCQGDGFEKLEMYFFEDAYVTCRECEGRRYRPDVRQVAYQGRDVSQVLQMTVDEAIAFFAAVPGLARRLRVLQDVGLGYLRLGQSATTLSGGEAQRLKIAAELGTRLGRDLLYILDEPTTGLHLDDVRRLLGVLQRLVDAGNTVLVVEHHLDVVKCADWILDLGPEGGDAGGALVAAGPPEVVAQVAASYTGKYLRDLLRDERDAEDPAPRRARG